MKKTQMIQRKLILLLLFVFMIPSLAVQAQKKKGRFNAREIKVPEGIVYDVLQYREGKYPRAGQMAISYKPDGIKKKPVVLFIHGGGWSQGDKDSHANNIIKAAQQGFVGVTISYRLIPEGNFVNCIEDVKEAIRFLKSKKDEVPIDVTRIGVWGYSAGAHLALMIALSPEDTFHSNTYTKYDSKIKTVMAVSGPTDFVYKRKEGNLSKFMSESQNKNLAFLKEVSPLTYIQKKQIPVYIMHGTADPLVLPYHYLNFKNKCTEEEVANFKLFEIENGNHTFYWKRKEEVIPIYQEFLECIRN